MHLYAISIKSGISESISSEIMKKKNESSSISISIIEAKWQP